MASVKIFSLAVKVGFACGRKRTARAHCRLWPNLSPMPSKPKLPSALWAGRLYVVCTDDRHETFRHICIGLAQVGWLSERGQAKC